MKKQIMTLIILTTIFTSSVVNAMSLDTITSSCQQKMLIADDLYEDKEFLSDIHEYLTEAYGEEYAKILKKNAESVKKAKKIEQNISKEINNKVVFPSYYGGMFINENDELVVQITTKENLASSKNKYEEIINIADNVIIEEVKYSYEELKKVHDKILDYFMNSEDSIVSGLYIDTISNSVVVELKNYNDIAIDNFKKKIIDSPVIRYDNERKFEEMINPGQGLTSVNTGGGCSWGYRARTSSGQNGMVTAAHCFSGVGDTASGVGSVSKWKNSEKIDAAWVVTSSGTNTLNQQPPFSNITTLSTTVISSFYTGQKIAKLGMTTGYTVGTVTSASYSGTFGTPFTDLVLSSLPCNSGDSGGIVMEQTATLGNGFKTAGIVKAGQSGTTNMVFSKATNINSEFGLSRY